MPDDIIEENVTEQSTPEVPPAASESAPNEVDEVVDEEAAFLEEDTEDELGNEIDTPPDEGPKPDDESDGEDDDILDDEGDVDEDLVRGQELLDANKPDDEQNQTPQQTELPPQNQQPKDFSQVTPEMIREERFDAESIRNVLLPAIPKNILPKEPIQLENGQVLDLNGVVEDMPELPAIISIITNNMVRQMAASGFLAHGETVEKQVKELTTGIDDRLFKRTIMHPRDGVPNAGEILQSEDFQKWYTAADPREKALFGSDDPHDVVKGLKRYLSKGLLAEAKADKDADNKKRAAARKTFNGVHKSQKKRTSSPKQRTSALSPEEEERLAFESDDDDDFL